MRIIGLDIGEKRIGVAKADSNTRIAVPVGFLNVDGTEWQEIARLSSLYSTNVFILGLPRSNEGAETQQSLYVRNFAKTLLQKFPGFRIRFQDESLTSVVAEERLKKSKKSYEKGDIDAEAAAIILQDFLETLTNPINPPTPPETPPPAEPTSKIQEASSEMIATASEIKDTATNIAKKQSDKVKLNTKKAAHKMKNSTKWISGIAILVIVALITTGTLLLIREGKHREYQAWLEEQAALQEDNVFSFTILPGETIYDIKQNLIEIGYPDTEVEQAFNASYNYSFLADRPQGATLEGYLLGETHEFYKDTSVREIVETYLKGTEKIINDNNLKAAYEAHGLSLFEGITLASIVQKEANENDMPTVAQVFYTRLANNMFLGSDVTVSYALDTIDPNRLVYTENSDALSIDSCYNTRAHAGLPCGPISNPGLAALLAVANPSDTSYLYFLTGDDGMMYYSYTEEEHLINARDHCQQLCQVSL